MADTTVKIDDQTRDRFQALAADAGMSMRAYLAELAVEKENQKKLGRATESFRAAVARPGFAEAFERDFGGGPVPSTRPASRAA
ncbi:antitoxin MazE7 [Streptomyces roseoverticillatus]|uniref:antitoxin MazE7 n=1 Tax=Streptomyces roseoverticillatus TaxID=66429 RepID=UPI001F1CC227|nr:antitoxin MazE7 [Streptomyces roseoverticillatus]MCF3104058.1 antitoxin MazE7 [Streptomyces roseoverticillatus]